MINFFQEGYHTFRGGFWNYFSMGMNLLDINAAYLKFWELHGLVYKLFWFSYNSNWEIGWVIQIMELESTNNCVSACVLGMDAMFYILYVMVHSLGSGLDCYMILLQFLSFCIQFVRIYILFNSDEKSAVQLKSWFLLGVTTEDVSTLVSLSYDPEFIPSSLILH